MFDGNHRCQAIAHVRSGKVGIFFLQNSQFSGIIVDDRGKYGFESRQMGAALRIVNIIAEPQHIFMEFIDVLKGSLHCNPFIFPFKIHHVMDSFRFSVQVFHKTADSLFLMKFQMFCDLSPPVLINNGQPGIQVSRLMQAAFHIFFLETSFFKNFRIRQEINSGSRLFGFSGHRQHPLIQLQNRISPLISVMIYFSSQIYFQVQICGQCIHHGGTHAVKTAAGLIGVIVKFSSCMEGGKYQPRRRHAFFMHSHGNSPAIVLHGTGAVCLQCYRYGIAKSCQMFIHRIVYNFVNQMIQALAGHTSNIHARPFSYRFQSLQYGNIPGTVFLILCHFIFLPYFISKF